VLLKNERGALPLKAPRSLGIIGNDAGPDSRGPNGYSDRGGDDGILAVGWGSGTAEFPYLIDPLAAITDRSRADRTTIASSTSDSDLAAAATVAQGKDAALVFISADSGEGYITVEGNAGDRNDLQAWHGGDALVTQVANNNKNTIVVVNSVGPLILEKWINHPNVTGVVWSGLGGQEAGNSLVDVLYGAYNPSGRLPYTIAKSISDYSAQVIYTSSGSILPIPYTEGLQIDYRRFDSAKIEPRFEFGFGLSYTTFDYSSLRIRGSIPHGAAPTGPGSSADRSLHSTVITVSFTLKNTGHLAGTEVPQLYLNPPAASNGPPSVLRGFDAVNLGPGQSRTVSFGLSRYALSNWDVVNQRWVIPSGTFRVTVGSSSRNARLKGSIPS